MANKKPELPFGWIVKQSKSYPDRIYYFNVNTGASTWEFPDLLQHYVTGKVVSAVPPVLTATSLTAVSAQNSVQLTKQQPCADPVHKPDSSCTRSNVTGKYNKSAGQEPQFSPQPLSDNESENMEKPFMHKLEAAKQNLPENYSKAYIERRQSLQSYSNSGVKSSTLEDKFSDTAKRRGPSFLNYDRKRLEKGSEDTRCAHKVLSGVYQRKLESVEPQKITKLDHKHIDTKTDANLKGSRRDVVHPYERKATQTYKKTSLSKSHDSTDLKLNIAKLKDELNRDKKRSVKLSPIDFPKGNAETLQKTLSGIKSCVRSLENSSKKVIKGTGDETKAGKRTYETLNKTDSSSALALSAKLKRQNKDKSACIGTSNCNIVTFSKRESRKSMAISSSGIDDGPKSKKLDTDRQTSVDKRRVVRSIQSRSTDNRSVSVQDKKISNFHTNKKAFKLSPEFDLTVSTSAPLKSSCEVKVADEPSDIGSDFDPNNNTEFKLFIGDKEKLLSIQSWINNLQEGAGSESPSTDSHSQVNLGLVNESVDSGYVSITNRPASPSRRGWPGALKKSDVTSREVVAMEIDECLVSKELLGGGDVNVAVEAGVDGEECMDIDEVLVEVRQQVSLCSNQNVGSFVSLSDTDNSTPLKRTYETITVVVDTNILISNLELLETLKDYQLPEGGMWPCLLIPWIVLRELDALKETVKPGKLSLSLATQKKARMGISFLKTLFSSKHPRVKGQTPKQAEDASHNFKSKCNDDVILQACLQCQQLGSYVVLLTNDNNLINKSLVSSVPAFNAKDIMSGLQTTAKTVTSLGERQTPASVQCQTPASVQCQTSASNHYQIPVSVQCQTPFSVHGQTPTTVLCQTPVSIRYQTPDSVHCQTKASTQCHTPASVQCQAQVSGLCQTPVSCKTNNVRQTGLRAYSVQAESSVSRGKKFAMRQEVVPSSKLQQTCLADKTSKLQQTCLADKTSKLQQTCLADKILNEEKTSTVETLVYEMYCKMKTVLHEALGKILEVEMQKAYDDIWIDIVYKKPPWGSLKDVLECWKKHWIAVFGLVFSRHLSKNIHQLLDHISSPKGITVNIVYDVCEASSEILQEASTRNVYGPGIEEISKTLTTLRQLCNRISHGEISAASISSVEHYIQSQVSQSVVAEGLHQASVKVTSNNSQCTTTTSVSVISTFPNISLPQRNFSVGSENQTVLQCSSLQTPSQNLQSVCQVNPAVTIHHSDQTVINSGNQTSVGGCSTSPEIMAGEQLTYIWKFIYKYCDEFYRTVSGNASPDVLKNIEPVLKVLVSTSLELRKYFAGLLELPISDLKNREEEFTALSHICNSFFSKLNVQELESHLSDHFGRTPLNTPFNSQPDSTSDSDTDEEVREHIVESRVRSYLHQGLENSAGASSFVENEELDEDLCECIDDVDDDDDGDDDDDENTQFIEPDSDRDQIKWYKAGNCCKLVCHNKFTQDQIFKYLLNIKEMDKETKEMYIMGLINDDTSAQTTQRGKKRQRMRRKYTFLGTVVCKKTFLLCHDIGKKTLSSLCKHISQAGITPRRHGNLGRKPHNAVVFEDVQRVVRFIRNYADERGIPQPAAPRGRDDIPPIYLPSDTTKVQLHKEYTSSCTDVAPPVRHLSLSVFKTLWSTCVPHIKIATPRDDVCVTCERMRKIISGAVSEDEKLEALANMRQHILIAQRENVPIGLVTPLHLLIVYSKPEYRETLGNFLTQLDEMLKMMYQCLHKLCPDD